MSADITKKDSKKRQDNHIVGQELLQGSLNSGKPLDAETMFHELGTITFAGTDTVANTLTMGTFRVLEKTATKERLMEELRTVWPDIDQCPTFEALKRLPYLVGPAIRVRTSYYRLITHRHVRPGW